MDYISKPALMGKLTSSGEQKKIKAMTGEEAYNEFLTLVNSTEKADVAPVRRWRWDDSGRYTFPGGSTAVRCTGCGCALTVSEYRLNCWNYCPVCGARMDGGAAE